MKILFICLSNLKFNILAPYDEPLGGTESAISYLAPRLVKRGHEVTLLANTEDVTIGGVRHMPMTEDIAQFEPDVVIVTSAPQACPAIKKIVPKAKIVLWCHMRPDQPAMQFMFSKECVDAIDQIAYVSDIQKKAFEEVTIGGGNLLLGKQSVVINNAIAPMFENMFTSAAEIAEVKQCKGAYTSTPFRGLGILAQVKEIPIEVYSSMAVYQGDDMPFAPMYEALKQNDCIEMKGSISQTALRDALKEVSFLVYPSIFPECHSIAILEAMAAGLRVITTDVAHPQTEFIVSMSAKDGSVEEYTKLLRKNVNSFRSQNEAWANRAWDQVRFVNDTSTWDIRAAEWDKYLQELTQSPDLDKFEQATT